MWIGMVRKVECANTGKMFSEHLEYSANTWKMLCEYICVDMFCEHICRCMLPFPY